MAVPEKPATGVNVQSVAVQVTVPLDGCVYEGWNVPIDYDPLLAKLAVWAGMRDEAIARMIRALGEYDVGGIRTNLGFFGRILEEPAFHRGKLHTGFIDEFLAQSGETAADPQAERVAALVAALHAMSRAPATERNGAEADVSPWLLEGRSELLR